jgi:8-oxo-dGTP diphosphatase
VYLVRHAHAGSRSAWSGDDRDRPLSTKGRAQADALRERLRDLPIGHLTSSPFRRCIETLDPLAAALGLEVEPRVEFSEGADTDTAIETMLALADLHPVVSSHGDLIPKVIRRLVADGMETDTGAVSQKGSLWVLEVSRGRVVRGRYEPPPTRTDALRR